MTHTYTGVSVDIRSPLMEIAHDRSRAAHKHMMAATELVPSPVDHIAYETGCVDLESFSIWGGYVCYLDLESMRSDGEHAVHAPLRKRGCCFLLLFCAIHNINRHIEDGTGVLLLEYVTKRLYRGMSLYWSQVKYTAAMSADLTCHCATLWWQQINTVVALAMSANVDIQLALMLWDRRHIHYVHAHMLMIMFLQHPAKNGQEGTTSKWCIDT